MHRILTFFLGLHWVAHFGILAVASAGLSSSGAPALGTTAPPAGFDAVLGTAMALGFGIAAVLFIWMLVTVLFDRRPFPGDTDDVARLAFAVATGMLTLLLFTGADEPVIGLMPAVSLQIAALLVSYVAVNAERRFAGRATRVEGASGANSMALHAAHNTMLSRISGRSGAKGRS